MSRRLWRNFDPILVLLTVALIIYGIAMIQSATRGTEDLAGVWKRQAIYALAGLVVMWIVALFDYHFYESLYIPIFVGIIILLSVVLALGSVSFGAQRWIEFRLFPIQPSEVAKVIMIIVLAKVMADRDGQMHRFRYTLLSLAFALPVVALIYAQPDLGTSLTILFIWLVMALMAGMSLLHLVLMGGIGLLATPFVWVFLEDYMRQRVMLFFDPQSNPDEYYNVSQALISIGSGGWFGKGFGSGSQSQLHFLRVRHTDYVFSVIGEELGFVGALVLFILFALLLWRVLRAVVIAQEPFGRLLCTGVAVILFFQTFVNIAVNLSLVPVTGMPLPLVSYGGSSLITFMIALGLVESVAMRHKKLDFE